MSPYIITCMISAGLFILSIILLKTSYYEDSEDRIKIKLAYFVGAIILIFIPALNFASGLFTLVVIICAACKEEFDSPIFKQIKKILNKEI